MTTKIPNDLVAQLRAIMTISRLLKTGLFKKLDTPVEEIRPHLSLYRAILDKALLDQFDKDKNYRLQSKLWVDKDNPDFCEICDLALLDVENVIQLFDEITEIFRENGEDIYWEEDLKVLHILTQEEREYFLNYEEE